MNVAHWYHVYAAGAWEEPVSEHLWALNEAKFDGPVFLGLVGPADERLEVLRRFEAALGKDAILAVHAADEGWEQVTISALHAYAQNFSGAILYAHTKGASEPCAIQDQWRRSMTAELVMNWRAWSYQIEKYDAIGCHWLQPGAHSGDPTIGEVHTPMFGGNFWMASCEYLRTLPPVLENTRHDAEAWVGQNNPRVLDLLPGWPPSGKSFRKLGRLAVPA